MPSAGQGGATIVQFSPGAVQLGVSGDHKLGEKMDHRKSGLLFSVLPRAQRQLRLLKQEENDDDESGHFIIWIDLIYFTLK